MRRPSSWPKKSPQEIRAALPLFAKHFMAESQAAEDALKQAQAFEQTQRGKEMQAMMAAGGTPQMQDVKYTNLAVQQAVGQKLSADDGAFMKGYEERKTIARRSSA